MGFVNSIFGQMPLQLEWFWAGWFFLTCALIWFVVWILVAIWVYRDAESRRMGGALWLIIVILLGLIGIIVYLIVRSDKPVLGTQPAYGQYQPYQQPQQPFQPPPGGVQQGGRFCPKCGASVSPGVLFCPQCGNRL